MTESKLTGLEAYKKLDPANKLIVDGARHCPSHQGLAEAMYGGRGPGLEVEDETRYTALVKMEACETCAIPEEAESKPQPCTWKVRRSGLPVKCGKPLPCAVHPDATDDEEAAVQNPNRVQRLA